MKIAHIIIFHEDAAAIERLIKAMSHPEFDFYLHLDKKVAIAKFKYLADLPNVTFIKNRKSVQWAGFSQIEAILNSITEIIKNGKSYEFINLLSGQDYPIKPANFIYDFLSKNKGATFMMSESAPSEWWSHASTRFTKYHFVDYRFKGKFRISKWMSKFLPVRKFPLQAPLYGGPQSAYWILNIKAARYIIQTLNKNDKNWHFFKHTWGSDEFLLNTLLMDSPLRETIVNENFHLIDRSQGGTRPKTLTVHDFEMLKNSHKFFARKFDRKIDHKILDMVDQQLLSLPPHQETSTKP